MDRPSACKYAWSQDGKQEGKQTEHVCSRYMKSFRRKYHLTKHLKEAHGIDSDEIFVVSGARSYRTTNTVKKSIIVR